MVPASAIADVAYTGSIIDTSDLAAELTRSIHTSHPYRAEDKCRDSIERIRDTHGLDEAYGITGSVSDTPRDSNKHNVSYQQRYIKPPLEVSSPR